MSQPAILLTGLQKTYGNSAFAKKRASKSEAAGPGNDALKNIDLTIPKGSIFGLLGPNGAGKSTLINILAGLVNKTSGQVVINGINQDDDPRATRYQLGVVPQEVTLDPFFNVRETLEYHAGYYGIPASKRRTDDILKAMHLTEKAGANSRRLSGGMKRRVLIAKALVHSPPILILDEPTAGVDVELRSQLWSYVRELNAKGTTILLTTHYLEEAEELCDHIAIINHGQIIANDNKLALMQLLDQKQLTLKLVNPVKKAPEFLTQVQVELLDPHTIQIRYAKSTTSFKDLLQAIGEAKLNVADISTAEPDLEDIFRHLIK